MTLKIGVLLPNSNFISKLGQNLIYAIKAGFKTSEFEDFELIFENCGFNADKKLLEDKTSKLMVIEGVDVIIAPLNPGAFLALKDLCLNNEVPLIVPSLGEDALFNEYNFDYLFVNSFNEWQSNWMLGYWASQNLGKKTASFNCFHEGGYKLSYAFALGQEANGGSVIGNQVTHREKRDESSEQALDTELGFESEFFTGFYSSKEAISFLSHFENGSYKGQRKLIGNSFMVDPIVLKEVGAAALGVHSVSSWNPNNESEQNKLFVDEFIKQNKRFPDAYSLLTYESVMLLSEAVKELGVDNVSGESLKNSLSKVKAMGPRGEVNFIYNGKNDTGYKSYLSEVVKTGENGSVKNQVIEELEIPDLYYEQLELAKQKLFKQGWNNPYLIA